ncbi:MAG: cytochrome C oxidase subunit IV [Flavobacteriales bacterium]|nr:cytochrome C oxidase subunit IV [Flavobacteriales bacterium]
MGNQENESHWWIWKVFWILLIVTAVEVVLGIIKPPFLVETIFLGTKLLNHVFIILTIIKAAYIVSVFMHLGFERKSLIWTILLPAFILVPYLLFIILTEGAHAYLML